MQGLIRPTLGLLQGVIIYFLINQTHLGQAGLIAAVVLFTFPLFALQLKLPEKENLLRGLAILVMMALVYSYTAYHLTSDLAQTTNPVTPILIAQTGLSLFIFFIFYCVLIEEKRFRFPYVSLFNQAWQIILKLILGQLLVYLIWGLFVLAALLFQLLNISVVHDIMSSNPFFYIMPPLFFGIAMTILYQYESLLTKLRNILLAFCQILYPIFVVINICFLIIIPFAHIQFANFWHIIILLSTLNIVLFNGIYQAGFDKAPYPTWFCLVIYLSLILSLIYSIYVLKFPWAGVGRPDQLLLLLSMVILALYNVFYVLAIFCSRKPWLNGIKISNTGLALLTAIVYLVLALTGIGNNLSHMLALQQQSRDNSPQVMTF